MKFTVAVRVAANGYFEWTQFPVAACGRSLAVERPGRVIPIGTSQIAPGHAVSVSVSGVELPCSTLDAGLGTNQGRLLL